VVELNRAVAVSMVEGPAAGLMLMDCLAARGSLDGYHLLASARAGLLRRLGRAPEAVAAYRQALALARFEPDRRWLKGRIAALSAGPS
jgi:RNA polymerase sigma-70 factor (ECF subfamily)